MVTLGSNGLALFPRFSRYNSPYAAHRDGRAVDLYPETATAPSPVAGEVIETRTMNAPSRAYAAAHDHLIVIDTGTHLARILHVDPAVAAGDRVEHGDPLGTLVRSGYFAPWVDNHVHLGFRSYGADPVRASGSLPVEIDVPVVGTKWEGTGTVREAGETYAILDTPVHSASSEEYVGITDDTGDFVFDGGVCHYESGGVLPIEPSRGGAGSGRENPGSIRLLGTALAETPGTVTWADVSIFANGEPIMGLSFVMSRTTLGAKLICPEFDCAVGEDVTVEIG